MIVAIRVALSTDGTARRADPSVHISHSFVLDAKTHIKPVEMRKSQWGACVKKVHSSGLLCSVINPDH
jgi:hypothetical protein